MKSLWKWIKKCAVPIICVLIVIFVLLTSSRIAIPWRTGNLEDFYYIDGERIATVYFLSSSEEGYTYLLLRDAGELGDYLFSLQIRPKFWQADTLGSAVEAELSVRDDTSGRMVINIIDDSTIYVNASFGTKKDGINAHFYTVKDGVDFDYIRACFDGAEDLSSLYNGE